jgi:hypothetical protein
MQDTSGSIQIRRSTFRKGIIVLYAFFLSLIAYTFTPQLLTPKPGEKSLRCSASHLYVGLARAAGQNCKTKCTNWEAADCSGYSSCYNKNISCNNGIDQEGRSCQGCCYDCVVVCEPDPDKPPSISGSVSCGQWGTNGWCISSASLDISASDPQGYDLTITGNAKSRSISCNGSCSIDLPAGSGTADYVVTASQSGLSASGGASWDFDPNPPNLDLNVSGSSGRNGWYRSSVSLTATGSDSLSGLAGAFLSVDGGSWQSSATLSDGKHNVELTAADHAGNIVNSSTSFAIDTKSPSISVSIKGKTGTSNWYASETTVSASASDSTSGIASIEVSIDGGSYQSYSSSITFPNGKHTIQFRAEDKAGNSTETSKQTILIDLNSPTVTLDVSNFSNKTIIYKAHDDDSGLSVIYITIEDKDGKYPKVKWSKSVSGKNVPGQYVWDGNFDGGITAPPGEYSVWIKAVDQVGNEDTQAENVIIPDPLLASTNLAAIQEEQFTSSTDASEEGIEEDKVAPSDLTFGGDTSEPTEVTNQTLSLATSASSGANNPFPWESILGAVTVVATGATTYTVTKVKKTKKQKQETRARLLAELEVKWEAEARAKEAAQNASKMKMQVLKTERFDAQDEINWQKAELAEQKAKKEAELKAVAVVNNIAKKKEEKEAASESNWWEKTKSFISEKIIQPIDTYIVDPFIEPAIVTIKDVTTKGIEWIDETIYQPYLESIVEKAGQSISNAAVKFNETVIQPIVQPWVERQINKAMETITKVNTNIVQPLIVPALEAAYENFYKPYVEPILEPAVEKVLSVIDKTVYEPIIQPTAEFINENIYEPIFKPVFDDIKIAGKELWDKYGESIHGSLDAVGFIPGLGDIADAVNGLLYLGEGNYLEAGIAALAMIPVLGDLGKVGKWGLKAGQEVVEEVGEKIVKEVIEEGLEKVGKETTEEVFEKVAIESTEGVVEKIAKETTEGAVEKVAKETTGEAVEKVTKETTSEAVEKVAKETTSEVAEKATQKVAKNITSKTLSASVENATENVVQKTADNLLEKAAKNTGEAITSATSEKASKEIKEKLIEQALEKVDDKTAALVRSVAENIGDDVASINKAVTLVQKHGDDAVKALKAVQPEAAAKVLRAVDDNILDDIVKQGTDAFEAFSGWAEKELIDHSKDLAARATKDAEVLNDVKTLVSKGPIDPKNLTDEQKLLIEKIAANSTFISDGKQVVVGKWVGLDGGFLARARETGSLHYSPHPDLWRLFEGLENQNEVAWLINKEVIQTGIVKGLPFEYTLDGILAKDIANERAAIKAIFSGQTEEIIKRKLKSDYLPVRLKELQELKNAGFDLAFNEMNNSYKLTKP